MSVQKNIVLPVWNKTPMTLRAVQGEARSRTITATLIDAGSQPVDLTGAAVRLFIQKPDNTVNFMDGTVTDATGGVCSFILPSGATAAAGTASCQILASWPDNSSLKVVGLSLEILPSNMENATESSDDFSALVVALNSVKQTADIANQAAANAQKAVTDAQASIASTNAAASEANSAAIAANAGAAAANQAATDTAAKYRMINPLTGQEDYVTNVLDQLKEFIFSGAITAQEFDNLHLTAEQFDALMISARDFDTKAKSLLVKQGG